MQAVIKERQWVAAARPWWCQPQRSRRDVFNVIHEHQLCCRGAASPSLRGRGGARTERATLGERLFIATALKTNNELCVIDDVVRLVLLPVQPWQLLQAP